MEAVFTEFQKLNGTTWFYLSTLLAITVFFRFNRFFCLRNWDLVTLCLLVPGLLATARVDKRMLQVLEDARLHSQVVSSAPKIELAADSKQELYCGYLWLMVGTGYLCLRCFIDLFLARRPRLPPNLDVAGLSFLGVSLLAFLFFEAVTKEPDPAGRASAVVAASLLNGEPTPAPEETTPGVGPINPGTTLYSGAVHYAVDKLIQVVKREKSVARPSDVAVGVARSAAILAHLFILAGLVVVGAKHFGSLPIGVGMATLYLMTPLTAVNIAKIDQLLPGALLLWAVVFHRKPRVAGALLGVSCAFLFPIFLIPLWLGFYGTKGALRCLSGIVIAGGCVALLFCLSDTARDFTDAWASSVVWRPDQLGSSGHTMSFWTETTQFYRLPIFVMFMFVTLAVAFWPIQKNLAELVALSVLLILGTQFWYPHRGGTFVHWYLPLFLLMMFRPNLQNALPPDPAKA